jgi:hypothetical protein
MSRTWVVVLSSEHLRVYTTGTAAAVAELPWQADTPESAVRALASLPNQPSQLVLVVGLAWLEAVPLSLPPVALAQQRQMLQVDADRWFPFSAPPAVAITGQVAMAMPADTLSMWVRAFAAVAPVDGVVGLPQAALFAGLEGLVHTSAAAGETGLMEFRRGVLVQVRRTTQSPPAGSTALDEARCAQAVLQTGALSLDVQLLNTSLEHAVRARRRAVWWRAAALAMLAGAFFLWSADQWRARTLTAMRSLRDASEGNARAALDADARRQRATRERVLLNEAATSPQLSAMLATLGETLPADVFVQRAEWDGTRWRLDGSARDAAPLVPLLAGIPGVQDVRSLAPSTRFLDGGQQRSSFSIGFSMASALADSTAEQTP